MDQRGRRRDERTLARWRAARQMLAPELERYRARYPHSRRCRLLEALEQAMLASDEATLASVGLQYLRLTDRVPPGCFAVCATRQPSHFLSGERVNREPTEVWTVHLFSPQVWR